MTWGAQFPVAGSALKLIDPFYYTLLRYVAISLILVALLILAKGPRALSVEGKKPCRPCWSIGPSISSSTSRVRNLAAVV